MAASPTGGQLPDFDVMLAEVGAKVARAMLGNSKATVAARKEEKSCEMRRLSSIVQVARAYTRPLFTST